MMNKTASRTVEILEFLSEQGKSAGISEISRSLDIPKSSVFDIVYTLEQKGFIEIDNVDLKTFKLSFRIFQVGSTVITKTDLYQASRPLLKKLRDDTGETVYIAVESKGSIIYIDKVESDSPMRSTCNIGSSNFMHLTGLGKALLATYNNEKVKKITGSGELKIRTKQTITSYNDLVKHLQTIRETGYSFDDREDMDMVCCMAAPIYDYTGNSIAAISVSMPYANFNEEKKKNISEKVINTALDISHRLGYAKDKLYTN